MLEFKTGVFRRDFESGDEFVTALSVRVQSILDGVTKVQRGEVVIDTLSDSVRDEISALDLSNLGCELGVGEDGQTMLRLS